MHLKTCSWKAANFLILLFIAIYLSTQNINVKRSHIQRTTANDHKIPFSLRRLVRHEYQKAAAEVIYKITWIKYECQYIYAQILESYKVLLALQWGNPLSMDKLMIRSANEKTLTNINDYRENFTKLLQPLQPSQQKIAERIQHHCVLESIRINKMAKHFVTTQILQWYQLIHEWNSDLLVPEDTHPYHFQENVYHQELALLSLRQKRRLTLLKIHRLYQYQLQQVSALALTTSCTYNHYQDPSYDEVVELIDSVRKQKYQALKMQMYTHLKATKNSLKLNLESSFNALNDSIFIEKGKYYHVLHPENPYILVIHEQNWRRLIKSIETMWDDVIKPSTNHSRSVWGWLKTYFYYVCAILTFLKKKIYQCVQHFQLSEA